VLAELAVDSGGEDEFAHRAAEADAILAGLTRITAQVIHSAPNPKAVSRREVGGARPSARPRFG
jgi:phosphoglycerate dehydrogenase-like enzyme